MVVTGTPLDALLDARHALLAFSGLVSLWMLASSARVAVPPANPATVPDIPGDTTEAWPRRSYLVHDDHEARTRETLVAQLRHSTATARDASELPRPLMAAMLVLGAAVSRPDGPDDATALVIAAAMRGEDRPSAAGVPSRSVLATIDSVAANHAWWECAAVELMARARAAGSWVTPGDLAFLAATEPGLLAALSAGPGHTVVPEGAGILAHHRAETMAGRPALAPHVDPAMPFLLRRLDPSEARR